MTPQKDLYSRAFLRLSRYVGLSALFVSAFLSATIANAQAVLTLQNSFIEKYKNAAQITTSFVIDAASAIHPASQDGDIHIAGRAAEAHLHGVAEIMNARFKRTTAVRRVKELVGTGTAVNVVGAWRIWPEHGGEDVEAQSENIQPMASSGAPHLFEIHPVTAFDGMAVEDTIGPIAGYQYKDADTAFTAYESTPCHITTQANGTTTITTTKVGYNYVEFIMKLDEKPVRIRDGEMAFAEVENLNGEVIVHRRRIVLLHGTQAQAAIGALDAGARVHVIGIPRLNLALVSWRVEHAHDPAYAQSDVLSWPLPYEIVIVGFVEQLPNTGDAE